MSKPTLLPAPLAAGIAAARTWLTALSRPAKVLLASSLSLALLFAIVISYRETHETYAVLFSQLDPEDAAGIVAKLKEQKTPYRIESGGTTIEVPESKVAEVRMDLVSSGLPRGGGVGFESFDKLRLGATEFEQRILYRRALEGELSRTIGAIASVQSARVHIVMPEKSVFVQRSEPASASILLHLRPGRSLGPSEVRGIVSLTAAAVPGLLADHIAILTADGQMLKRPRSGGAEGQGGSDDDVAGEQRALEAQLEDRARSMLERVVGPGHVDVRVTAEFDPSRVERVEDQYDPTHTALRSEEQTRERTAATLDDTVGGVPGAESNLNPAGGTAPAATPAASGSAGPARPPASATPSAVAARGQDQPFRESHTRNFEVNHISEKRLTNAGALKRLGVAVIVDGAARMEGGVRSVVPRDRAELDRFSALVRSAVGANDARGDSITVDSVPFEQTPASVAEAKPVEVPATPAESRVRLLRSYGPAAGVALFLVIAAVVAARRRRGAPTGATPQGLLPSMVESPQLAAPKETSADLRARALERAAQDPATAALVLRLWLGTTEAEVKA